MGEQTDIVAAAAENTEVRMTYKSIKSKIKDKDILFQANNFEVLMDQTNKAHEKAKSMPGRMEDMECIRDMVYQLNDQVKVLSKKNGTTSADFLASLKRKFMSQEVDSPVDPSSMDWESLGFEAAKFIKSIPGLCTMLGPMDSEPRLRKSFNRMRNTSRATETTVPHQLTKEGDDEHVNKETESNMEMLFTILRKRRKVPFVNLILNRESFAQTIENIFAFSFLVKDGRTKMIRGNDGTLIAVPMNAPTEEQRLQGVAKNSQFVLRIDFSDWNEMKQKVQPGDELMPHRKKAINVTKLG